MKEQNLGPTLGSVRLNWLVVWIKWHRYLRRRGWRKDENGWFRSFNPLLPPTATFYHEARHMSRDGITLEEAVKLARHSDPDDSYIYT